MGATYQRWSCKFQSSSGRSRQEQQPAHWGLKDQQNLYRARPSRQPQSHCIQNPDLPCPCSPRPSIQTQHMSRKKSHTASNRGGEAASNGRSDGGAASRSDSSSLQEHFRIPGSLVVGEGRGGGSSDSRVERGEKEASFRSRDLPDGLIWEPMMGKKAPVWDRELANQRGWIGST